MFEFLKRSKPPQPSHTMHFPLFGTMLQNVSEQDLLRNPTTIACVEMIAKSIALLPIHLYHKSASGRTKAGWHALYAILRHRPNLDEPSSLFIEKVVRDMLMRGNAYIWKSYHNGAIDSLYSLDPRHVKVYRSGAGQKRYEYADRTYTSKEILHIPGAFYDGLVGHSPAKFAAQAIRMGVKLDQFSDEAFDNGPTSRLALDISEKFPNGARPEDVRAIAEYIQRNYAGPANAGKPLILFDKMKATEISNSSNKDAELLPARKYQEAVIAKVFGVPLSMLGDSESNYGDFEQRQISFLSYTLGPWIKRLEQHFEMLLTPAENVTYYFEADPNVLLRTDLESRTKAYQSMLMNGILSVNEIRKKENLDKLSDEVAGNTHWILSNLVPLREDIVEAYMSGAKLKQQQLLEKEPDPPQDKKIT